ncbi:MAG TPA: glucose 1-dehydrogenase, partial [Salinimicrobium sp.]|nr:glucose 1-dehydrogenase [Salinimicrobium sp.]
MKAISLLPGTTNISLVDVEEPQIQARDEIKIKVMQVGICGTDREEASGGRADAPPGEEKLIIGHEMFGEVMEIGEAVKKVKKGDFGLFTVRRGCEKCVACKNNRSDMCFTGDYTERGIKAIDGFQAQYVVDKEQYFVKVPDAIKDIGVLTEPMSVAAKAIDEALIIQKARFKDFEESGEWLKGKKALVAGIGAIGLLGAFALRLRGAEVYGLDIVDEKTLRPQILKDIGGKYVDGRKVKTTDLDDELGEMDFIFEATGFAELQVNLIDALGINGIYVQTGIPGGNTDVTIDGANLMRQLVLKNQVVLGSVNASPRHFEIAVADLKGSKEKWPEAVKQLITEKVPFSDFKTALKPS